MNKITFGKYQKNDSIINKIDVRLKLIFMVFMSVLVFLPLNFYQYLFLILFSILLVKIAKINFVSILKLLKPMSIMFLFLLLINILVIKEGMVILNINDFLIYDESIIQTLYIIYRIVMLLILSTLLTSSTNPTDLTYGIEYFIRPLKIFKINVHEIAITISIAIRFIRTLIEEATIIMKAQTSRGVDFEYGKSKDKILAITSIIIPLFIICFDKAEDLNNAMIVRGYDSNGKRSRYRDLKFSKSDYFSLIFIFFLFALFYYMGVIL